MMNDVIQPELQDKIDQLFPDGLIAQRPIGELEVTYNDITRGTKVSFTLRDKSGVFNIALKRAFSKDEGAAVILQTWAASAIDEDKSVSYDDSDPEIRSHTNINYWLEFSPIADGEKSLVGPQELILGLDQTAPDAISDFDASHEALSGGTVSIGVTFSAPVSPNFGSCKIYVSGYESVTDYVAIAQESRSPFRFNLAQTGEAVTFKAISVSLNGIEAANGPTVSLTLGTTATAPAKPMNVTATEIATGVQIAFPASPESSVTGYKVRRAAYGAGEGAASTINTVAPTGAAAYSYLDTDGLKERYEYYVRATNGTGDSSASAVAIPRGKLYTSADLPNGVVQQSNTAKIDSVDAGADTTVRVYDQTGGVGTTWKRKTGFGNTTVEASFAAQTFTGKGYTTFYVCYYNGSAFILTTSFFDVLPDGYFVVGAVTTVAAGGAGGTSGGGGSSGSGGGGTGGIGTDIGVIY
jgi:hypothetical protein